MAYIRWLSDIRQSDESSVGEKAAKLGELVAHGFEGVRGFCVTTEGAREAMGINQIPLRVTARLARIEIEDPIELEEAAEEIRAWVENLPLPPTLDKEILQATGTLAPNLQDALFAIRASRIVADVPNASAYASSAYTLPQAWLAVKGNEMVDHICKCWATPWSSRAIYYRHHKRMDPGKASVAVVVQPMTEAQTSGVMFTADPQTGDKSRLVINAVWGINEGMLAARTGRDQFVVDKLAMESGKDSILDRSIATKAVSQVQSRGGGLKSIAVPAPKQAAPCLEDQQIFALARIGTRVERAFGEPQQIEWCIADGKVLLLQARELTKS